jgi:hypothetical protein
MYSCVLILKYSCTGNYRQFSVIARPRQGVPCLLSTYETIMAIRNELKQYEGIFNIAFSPPNFVIHLNTLELQLQIL